MNEQTVRMGVNEGKVLQNVRQSVIPDMTTEEKRTIGRHLEREIQKLGTSEHNCRVAAMMRKLAVNYLP